MSSQFSLTHYSGLLSESVGPNRIDFLPMMCAEKERIFYSSISQSTFCCNSYFMQMFRGLVFAFRYGMKNKAEQSYTHYSPYKFVFQRATLYSYAAIHKKELIGVSCGDPSSLLLFLLFPHNNIMAKWSNEKSCCGWQAPRW